ncbi:MAG: class I SAM-dependent methyltransferase [Hyphomicrobiaceae bacterium]
MSFSPQWLDLREPADHRARNDALARKLAVALDRTRAPSIVDLGCGTGSNLRALAPQLGQLQTWTLVDYDSTLLDAARKRLAQWAERYETKGDELVLERSGQLITVRFRQADLVHGLDSAIGEAVDLVTAAALFDLCSANFIAEAAAAVADRTALFYTVLTYNGRQTWTPPHPADAEMLAAFNIDQQTDKGFGTAVGPDAAAELAKAFRRKGVHVMEAESPWALGTADAPLIAELARGCADAAAKTGRVADAIVDDWRSIDRRAAVVGHTDTLALPAIAR